MGELIFFVNNSFDYIPNWAPLSSLPLLIILYPPPPAPAPLILALCVMSNILSQVRFLLCIVAVNAYGNLRKSLILEITLYAP